MNGLQVYRVFLTQTHEFVVVAHNPDEARERLEQAERFTYDYLYDGRTTFEPGGMVYYCSCVDEAMKIKSVPDEDADDYIPYVNLEETENEKEETE